MEIQTDVPALNLHEANPGESDYRWESIKGIMGSARSVVTTFPYDSPFFELPDPATEKRRKQLVDGLMESKIGSKLWCLSGFLKKITDTVGTHQALDSVYLGPNIENEPEETRKIGSEWAHYCLTHLLNATGARNRLRVVENELQRSIDEFKGDHEERFNVLSVAAGSSRGLMTVISKIEGERANNIHLTMVDKSEIAAVDAKELASQMGIGDRMTFIKENVFRTNRYLTQTQKFNFIEVVGLLDYLDDRQVTILLGKLRGSLADGGVLLYSNITPNPERSFIKKIVGWPEMQYRKAEELLDLGNAAGFLVPQMRLIQEPSGVYNLVSAVNRVNCS